MTEPSEEHAGSPSRLAAIGGFCLLVLVITAISFFREPAAFLAPVLAYEDGRDVFAFYYNHPEASAIFRSYNGYVSVLPNFWGWLVMRGPITWAPYLLAWGPLLLSSFAFAFFALPLFRPLVASDRARAAIALIVAAAPLTNDLYLGNTMYSVWSLLLLLVLAALAPAPSAPGSAVVAGLAQGLVLCSHPLSILLVPVYLLRAFVPSRLGFSDATRGLPRVYYLSLAGMGVMYQLVGVSRDSVSPPSLVETAYLTLRFLLERVVFGSLFGDGAARALRRSGHEEWILVLALGGLGLIAIAVLGVRRICGRRHGFAGIYGLWIVVGLTILYVVGRSPDLSILGSDRAFRYFWTQRVLFLLALGVLGERLLSSRRRPFRWGVLAVVVLALGWLNRDNRSPYRVRPAQGQAVREFARQLAAQEEARGGREGVTARLDRGIWSLEIGSDAGR